MKGNHMHINPSKFDGMLTMSREEAYNYGGVSLDSVRLAVKENIRRFFGEEKYKTLILDYDTIRAVWVAKRQKFTFKCFMNMLAADGIHGFAQAFALALEWEFEPCIEDWEQSLNKWLDSPSGKVC
ncbi:hypothetical protein K3G63_14735 [Hymenobacter sp. HSC-4F20]|nr:hypothetical protein [Hymenobacter sp. HSC-4F20]